ncbi:hypothetical protein DRN69_07470 [Candidatus Pacearchaeota archaeon]|nr:MAG: hypothetical protein DRN69_07470 [Candidatus Pacearchaeota archaeon]
MYKRGSHVGVILSFVIFVTFLIFMYTTIEPQLKKQKDKQPILDYLEAKLIESFDSELTTFTIQIDKDQINPNKDCIKVQDLADYITEQNMDEESLIIKNSANNILSYIVEGQALSILGGENFDGFLKFYHSKDLQPSMCQGSKSECGIEGCDQITEYTVGSIKTVNNSLEAKINQSAERYNSEYEDLKKELKIPEGNDFGFILMNNQREVLIQAQKEILETFNVYAEEIPILYIDAEANTKPGFLTIKVW